jgi:hypothetical protein
VGEFRDEAVAVVAPDDAIRHFSGAAFEVKLEVLEDGVAADFGVADEPGGDFLPAVPAEIGRASCRERV